MAGSRWRLPAIGATVIVSTVMGIITNLITSKWSIALAVGLGVLLVIAVILQVALASGDGKPQSESTNAGQQPSRPWLRQEARARGRSSIIQVGGNAVLPPAPPTDGKEVG